MKNQVIENRIGELFSNESALNISAFRECFMIPSLYLKMAF